TAENPETDHHFRMGHFLGDAGGRAEDTGTNRDADHQRNRVPETKRAWQLVVVHARSVARLGQTETQGICHFFAPLVRSRAMLPARTRGDTASEPLTAALERLAPGTAGPAE